MLGLKKKKSSQIAEEKPMQDSVEYEISSSAEGIASGVLSCIVEDNITTITLYGKIEISTYEEYLKYLLDKIEHLETENIQIDIEKVVYISSAGLRVFQELAVKAKQRNINFEVINITNKVYQMFKMTGYNASIKLIPLLED